MTVFKPGDVCIVSKKSSQNYGKVVWIKEVTDFGEFLCISLKKDTVSLNRADGTTNYYACFNADWLEKLNVVFLPEYRKHVPEKDEEQDQPKQRLTFGSFKETAGKNAEQKQKEREERLKNNKGMIRSYRLRSNNDE